MDTKTSEITKLNIQVDSAIMNPVSKVGFPFLFAPTFFIFSCFHMVASFCFFRKVIAVRAFSANQTHIQIINLELHSRMKNLDLNETVVFWRWVSPNQLAIITDGAVYHLSIEGMLSMFPSNFSVLGCSLSFPPSARFSCSCFILFWFWFLCSLFSCRV